MGDQWAITITLFALSWSKFELQTFPRQFQKQESLIIIFRLCFFGINSIPKQVSSLEGTESVALFISQNPISSKPGKGGVQAQKRHKIDKVRPNFTFQDPHGPYRPHLGQF